ncbi:MAG: transposase [Leptospiraceae bacterium]|nr:transposase [Leptospiraceae bacterium]
MIDIPRSAIRKRKPASGLICLFRQTQVLNIKAIVPENFILEWWFESSPMSRKGDCWDNTVVRIFFKTIKTELIYRNKFENYEELRKMFSNYIIYNRKRLHSFIGYQSLLQSLKKICGKISPLKRVHLKGFLWR